MAGFHAQTLEMFRRLGAPTRIHGAPNEVPDVIPFAPAPYSRCHPEQTALYQVVQQHLEIDLALAGEDDWDGRVPAYVESEFRCYRECAILAYGFARTRCPDGGQDFLPALCRQTALQPAHREPSPHDRRMPAAAG